MSFEEFIKKYNELIKAYNRVYHKFASDSGLSDTAWIVLYELRMEGKGISQRDLGELSSLSKQTVNSAVKVLLDRGLVELQDLGADKRVKCVVLTEQGERFCKEHIDKIVKAEKRAFCRLTQEDAKFLIEVEKKYCEYISQEAEKVKNE